MTSILGRIPIDTNHKPVLAGVSNADGLTVTTVYVDPTTHAIATSSSTTPVSPTTVLNGKTTVATAGTRVVLASSATCRSVTVKALAANTGTIYVGNATVASTNGLALAPGDSVSMDIANLTTVNIDASVSGEGVTYIAVAA